MKKIFLLIFIFIALKSFGQFTQPQTISSATGLLTSRGGFRADSALILPHFTDTTRANRGPGPKFYPGDVIRTIDTPWMRSDDSTRWIKMISGTITADNGLTMSTATNVQLGGTLLQNTNINAVGFNLSVSGNTTNCIEGTVYFENTAGGIAFDATSYTGASPLAGRFATTTTGGGSTILRSLQVGNSSGVGSNGIGTSIEFAAPTTLVNLCNTSSVMSTVNSRWINATHTERTSQWFVNLVDSGSTKTIFIVDSTGITIPDGIMPIVGSGGTDSVIMRNSSTGQFYLAEATTGGITGITADNGLTANTSTNVQLGGTLLHNTTIDGDVSYTLIVQANHASNTLKVTNNGGGTPIFGWNTAGTGVGIAGQGPTAGVQGISDGIFGAVQAQTTSGVAFYGNILGSTNNTVQTGMKLVRLTPGTAAAGAGTSVEYQIQDDGGSQQISNQLISKWISPVSTSRSSEFLITIVDSATLKTAFIVDTTGITIPNGIMPTAGSGGTDSAVFRNSSTGQFYLAEATTGGITGITADNGLTANTSTNVQLGGTLNQVTTIATTSAYVLNITGSTDYAATKEALLRIIQTSATGQGIYVNAVSTSDAAIESRGGTYGLLTSGTIGVSADGTSVGVVGTTATGTAGVSGQSSNSGIGVYGQSVNNVAFEGQVIPASTNTIVPVLNVIRRSIGTPANGIGGSIDFKISNDASATNISTQLIDKYLNVTNGSETAQFYINLIDSGILKTTFIVDTTGITIPNGIMPTAGSGGTDSAVFRNSATGQYYLAPGGGGPGGGEANTASNLGGGLANFDSKSGVDLRFNSFASADFDLASNLITIDATKWLTISAGNAAYQPLDADLTTIAGLTATTDNFIVSVASAWASRTPSQVRTTLGLVIGTNVEAWDADLDTWAGKTPYAGDLVITTGKTVTFDHTSTFTTTDGQTYTFPTTSATIARTDAANTFTGVQTFSSAPILSTGTVTVSGNTITFPAVASTLLPNTTTSGVAASPTSSSTQTITHGLGRTPTIIRIYGIGTFTGNNSATPTTCSIGTFNSTGNRCVYQAYNTAAITTTQASQTSTTFAINVQTGANSFVSGVIQNVTSTTFDIVWTETGTSAAQNFLWEAQ